MPGATLPVGFANPALDIKPDSFTPLNKIDKHLWDECRPPNSVGLTNLIDKPETYTNAPLALQVYIYRSMISDSSRFLGEGSKMRKRLKPLS